MSKSDSKSSVFKPGRNWACVVYPDSAPSNWREILYNHRCIGFISPFHEFDINPDGEPKKPHYHVQVMFEGNKSFDQMKELFESFGGVGAERIDSLRGYTRYLCHLDNPEKYQYDLDDVVSFGGADLYAIINTSSSKYNAIREMMFFVNENVITSYAELLEYASVHRYEWFRALCDNSTVVMTQYIKTKCWERKRDEGKS